MDKPIDLLLFDPKEKWAFTVKEYLERDGRYKAWFLPGQDALKETLATREYALAIIVLEEDLEKGFAVARRIKMHENNTSVFFITNSQQRNVIQEAFHLGGDDIIREPFTLEELRARVDAIIRRTHKEPKNEPVVHFQIGKFYFDTRKKTLSIEGREPQKLTTKEGDLLLLLCRHANELLERQKVLRAVWRNDSYFSARSMDVYITKLRKLLAEDPTVAIVNIHGKGYQLITNKE